MDIKVDQDTVVVFDLDDTLYNELDYLKSAYKSIAEILEPIDWKILYLNMFSLYRSKENVFEFLSNQYHVSIDSLLEMYRNHQPTIRLFDGVLKVFNDIKSNRGKIGIITDGRSSTQRAKIESLGILEYIDKIVISEEIGSEKPSLANFKAVEHSLPAKTYYYIADNLLKDFIGPNELDWKTIALIDNGKNIHFEFDKIIKVENKPKNYILSFSELSII